MKKLLTLMLVLSMLLTLCACGEENAEPESPEETYYWRTEAVCRYPFGLDGTISAAAADGEHIFLCGVRDGTPCLARMDYTLDGGLRIGEAAVTALPGTGSPISLDCAAGRFLLLCSEEADGTVQYTVSTYLPDGTLAETYPVSIDAGDEARSILALPDGGFWLRGVHNIRRYSASGEELEIFTRERVEFCPPLLIGGEAVFQTIDTDSHRSKLNRYDVAGKLIPIDCDIDLRAPSAVCRSAAGEALMCMGGTLLSIGSDFTAERTVELDELYSVQAQYREVLSLDGNTYLLVPGKAETIPPENSGELICLTREWTIDNRRTVNIAFYGRASGMLAALKAQYTQLSPDHRVECLDYGADEEGLARLLRDISTGEGIDLIVSDGYSIDTAVGFTDLYPFLDADPKLSRESFVPGLLPGIERNGRLSEIWSGFSICTFVSDGAPVYTQESAGMERIFIESMQPYLYGDSDMDTALSIARGKLEIFAAEHSA